MYVVPVVLHSFPVGTGSAHPWKDVTRIRDNMRNISRYRNTTSLTPGSLGKSFPRRITWPAFEAQHFPTFWSRKTEIVSGDNTTCTHHSSKAKVFIQVTTE